LLDQPLPELVPLVEALVFLEDANQVDESVWVGVESPAADVGDDLLDEREHVGRLGLLAGAGVDGLGDAPRVLAVQHFGFEQRGVEVHDVLHIAEVACFAQLQKKRRDLIMSALSGSSLDATYFILGCTLSVPPILAGQELVLWLLALALGGIA
jgi:hypothetical protein